MVHYLDDFLLVGRTASGWCVCVILEALVLHKCLGQSIAAHETEGP